LYTREFYIITAMVPLGFLLLVLDIFCVYCYEYYLRGMEMVNNKKEEQIPQPPRYDEIFNSNEQNGEIGKMIKSYAICCWNITFKTAFILSY